MPYKDKKSKNGSSSSSSRKPNWQNKEISCLLEFIRDNRTVLQSSLTTEITNKKKQELWQQVACTISTACGVAERTAQDCREKWGAMKTKVLSVRQNAKKTGGGAAAPEAEWQMQVEAILGDNTSLKTGVKGGTDTFIHAGESVISLEMPQAEQTAAEYVICGGEAETARALFCGWATNAEEVLDQPTFTEQFSVKRDLCDSVILLEKHTPEKEQPVEIPFNNAEASQVDCDRGTGTQSSTSSTNKRKSIHKKSFLKKRRHDTTVNVLANDELWNQYLQSEIKKNESMAAYYAEKLIRMKAD